MSLLLDALKKAADDKKNLAINETDETPNDEESLELDLDLESSIEETSAAEDFPEVDETSIPQATDKSIVETPPPEPTNKTDTVSTDAIPEEAGITDTSNLSEENLETETLDTSTNNALEVPDESTAEPITTINFENPENKANTDKDSPRTNSPTITNNSGFSNSIENEKALLALINKSNQRSKQARLKQTITIAILVSLLLIGSGLFFYIKMDTASQEIFVANNNQAPINRVLEEKSTATPSVIAETNGIIKNTIPAKNPAKKIIPKKITKKTKPIHVVHTEKKDPVNTLILEAYNQFHLENYKQANKLYNQALLREPNNRDALLGLSAIAVKQQRYAFARQKYQYLLRLNPKDSIAIAGISSIKNDTGPQLNESQLKFMLKEQPDSAHLYFALGALYSSHVKWPEAQSAYFSAWSIDNKNADYAYNLAVSLDHLDKRDQALNFYELSLKLKQASSGNFSVENVLLRTRTLKENNE